MGGEIGLSRVHYPIHALGPGRRIGIWFQGCSIRCAGCMSLDTWAPARQSTTVPALMARIRPWLIEADGATISGGEPFDQPEALRDFLERLNHEGCGSILVYSGHPLDSLRAEHGDILALIDVLVSEPFDARHDVPVLLRGSSNQIVTCLTPRGRDLWRAAEEAEGHTASIDVIVENDGKLWLAGIPKPGDMARLSVGLARSGVSVGTSAGRLGGKS
ncbi:MAG: 4Fe-4S single cluster domain-containing protein [Hyphomicrobium sp.]